MEQLADPALPVSDIVGKCPAQQLMAVYKIPAFSGADQFLQLVAAARGKLAKVPPSSLLPPCSALTDHLPLTPQYIQYIDITSLAIHQSCVGWRTVV